MRLVYTNQRILTKFLNLFWYLSESLCKNTLFRVRHESCCQVQKLRIFDIQFFLATFADFNCRTHSESHIFISVNWLYFGRWHMVNNGSANCLVFFKSCAVVVLLMMYQLELGKCLTYKSFLFVSEAEIFCYCCCWSSNNLMHAADSVCLHILFEARFFQVYSIISFPK